MIQNGKKLRTMMASFQCLFQRVVAMHKADPGIEIVVVHFEGEYFPDEGIYSSLSMQWNAQLWTSSGDCHSVNGSQGWSTHMWTTCISQSSDT